MRRKGQKSHGPITYLKCYWHTKKGEFFVGAGKVAGDKGYSVVSLELKDADIDFDILEWNYTEYEVADFDFIWASPPCAQYSIAKQLA